MNSLQSIVDQGSEKLHILADFDRTLTKCFVNGEKRPSMISILRDDERYLGRNYAMRAHNLYDTYHPQEIDPNISLAEKKDIMMRWWLSHNRLLVDSGLHRSHIEEIAQSPLLELREGYEDFFSLISQKGIPLVIISASGIGGQAIEYYLRAQGVWSENIHVIGNRFLWDKNGYATGFDGRVIHTYNKDQSSTLAFPEIFEHIKNRTNVMLLGDSIGDSSMIGNFFHDNIWKIGFLNENEEGLRSEYRRHFDELIEGDGNLGRVNSILQAVS